MHIINLTINCKAATGDNTTIVCMNSDYVFEVKVNDCGTFVSAPVKKLVVRHNKEYFEVSLRDMGAGVYQAPLPPIDYDGYIDVGICGKETDSPDAVPVYASTAARYTCERSVLNGVVVLKAEPKLSTIHITENGTYKSADAGFDGYHEVSVNIPTKQEESRVVDLAMSLGDQRIVPSYGMYTMSETIVRRPANLIPENIKNGVEIGGIVGSYDIPAYTGEILIEDAPSVVVDI